MNYVKPYPLINPQYVRERVRAGYDTSLAVASQWEHGDLVEINAAGNAQKCIQTTPANIRRLGLVVGTFATGPLTLPRYNFWTARGVPIETLAEDDLIVFTYQHTSANNVEHPFTTSDLASVRNGEQRQLVFNTVEGVLTIRNGTTTPNVQLVRVVEGGQVGQTGVRVACRILSAHRLVG